MRVDIDAAIATVTFDNPPANSLSGAVLDELTGVTARIAGDDQVRAVVFASTGARAFLSGADISEFPAMFADRGLLTERAATSAALFERIAELPQPTVAAVQAAALGGGFEFALLCDFVIATPGARFALPEVGLGLIPGGGGTQRLTRRIGVAHALDMVMLGTPVTAERAHELGIVHGVVADDKLIAAATALAGKLAARSAVAVQAAKRALFQGADRPLPEALRLESDEFVRVAGSADSTEGVRAFMERRPAAFRHR